MTRPTPTPRPTSPLRLVAVIRVSGADQWTRETQDTQWLAISDRVSELGAEIIDVVKTRITVTDLADTRDWRAKVAPVLRDPTINIITYALDRLARPVTWGKDFVAIESLRAAGKVIYTPDATYDLGTETGYKQATAEIMAAGHERMKIKRRTRDGKKRHAAEGRWVQGERLPLGLSYAHDKSSYTWGYSTDAPKVSLAFRLLIQDGLGYSEIASLAGLTVRQVRRLYDQPIYKGIYESLHHGEQGGVRVFGGSGQPPQLISDEDWNAANTIATQRLVKRRKSRAADDAPHTVYSSHLYSAYEPMGPIKMGFLSMDEPEPAHVIYALATKGPQPIMACRCQVDHWEDQARCALKSWQPAERLISLIDTYLARVTRREDFLDAMVQHVSSSSTPSRDVEDERQVLRDRLEAVRAKTSRLVDLHLDGKIEVDLYDQKRVFFKREMGALQKEIDALANTPTAPTDQTIREMARTLRFDPAWDVITKKSWLRKFRARIRVSNEGVESASFRIPILMDDEDIEVDGRVSATPTKFQTIYTIRLGRRTWETLVGYDASDAWIWREKSQGLYRSNRAAELAGMKLDRLRYLIRIGRVQLPEVKLGRDSLWTLDEIEALKASEGTT